MTVLRALLVEDDVAIGRLLQAVALDAGVDLVHATQLEQARSAMEAAAGPAGNGFDVIVTDLMLPDGSGVDWLEEQWAQGRLADTRVVAFSAGVSEAARARLGAVGVQGFLHKPVSVDTLAQWLSAGPQHAAAASGARGVCPGPSSPSATQASPTVPEGASAAIASLFGGDRTLFESFQAACLARHDADLQQGAAYLEQGRPGDLRRLAHSLKSALRLLGEPALARGAESLEHLCATAQDGHTLRQAWGELSQGLAAWAQRTSDA